jgi:phosphoglycolate phosphatase
VIRARAAIFDLDGTLADTLADIATAMNDALAAPGMPRHDLAAYRRFVGEGVEQLATRALPADRQDERPALIERYLARYAEVLLDESVPYPGVVALLDDLAARGVPLGVLSNKPDPSTQTVTAALFGPTRFAIVAGRRPDVPRKPDPTAALAIAATLGVPPAETIFVGDTAIDMKTARAAGMIPVGVAWGFRPEELEAAGASLVAATPAAILKLF